MDYLAFPPVRGIRGTIAAPPSKSATNRALVLAALRSDPVELVRPLDSEDTRALVRCLESMGAKFTPSERGLTAHGPVGRSGGAQVVLDAGSSGTAARFLAAVAAAVPGRYRLTGSTRLCERPMAELVTALRSAGASIEPAGREGFLPLVISGKTLRSGGLTVDATRSSQFVSALLLAAVAVEGGLSVEPSGPVVSAPYVETTLETLAAFGHRVRRGNAGAIAVERGDPAASSYSVPGDWSSALPYLAAAGIAGGEVEVTGLTSPSSDADAHAADVLEAMGVAVERRGGSVRASGDARSLRPVSVDARDFPDAVPVLAALAAHAEGESRFRGVAHLRGKESDRLAALAALLDAAGANASAMEDELVVTGSPRPSAVGAPRLPTFDDHRMAMAAALLSLSSSGTLIENPGCVSKSYPAFFRDLETILVRG
ncbi:MAG TPA: 3-phosphoshikimate 1-carboxyvinyltransferase [Thermoanaerobaculia bacterium]|nr:3-phosphoshikimate 1-carboxyvinyltransferase [Thermoanaerobaculia bacterium]